MILARMLVLLVVSMAGAVGQTRPETRPESRPARTLSVRAIPFPVEGEGSFPCACAFSPDGRFLTIAWPLRIYDVAKRELVSDEGRATPSWTPAFGTNSKQLAVSSDRDLCTLDLVGNEWRPGRSVTLPVRPWELWSCPTTVAWSQDDSTILLVDHHVVRLWSPKSDETKTVPCGTGAPISAVCLGADFGVTLVTDNGYDTAIIAGGGVVDRMKGVGVVLCSQDKGSWLVLRRDTAIETDAGESRSAIQRQTVIEIWDAKTKRIRAPLVSFENDRMGFGGLRAAAFSEDGRILVTNDSIRLAAIRDGQTGAILHTIRHYAGDRLITFALSPDGKHLLTMGRPTARGDNGIVLWELTFDQTGK